MYNKGNVIYIKNTLVVFTFSQCSFLHSFKFARLNFVYLVQTYSPCSFKFAEVIFPVISNSSIFLKTCCALISCHQTPKSYARLNNYHRTRSPVQ